MATIADECNGANLSTHVRNIHHGIGYLNRQLARGREFAKACDTDERVKLYCKLPPQLKIDTPVGTYNPDWEIVTGDDEKLYLIRETKSTRNLAELRDKEKDNIACGKKHFEAIDVDYEVVTSLEEALNG